MTLILTDIDDCVLNFSDRFQSYVESQGLPTQGRLRDLWRIERLLGIEVDAVHEILTAFTRDHSVHHEPEPCARDVLPELHRAGYRFVGISACGTDPEYRARRLKNLEAAFGFEFEALHCVPFGQSKAECLAAYPSAIWVEDTLGNALTGVAHGHRTFLLDRPYNRVDDPAALLAGPEEPVTGPPVVRVATWRDILATLRPRTVPDLIRSAESRGVQLDVRLVPAAANEPFLSLRWIENVFGPKGAGRASLEDLCAFADAQGLKVTGHVMDGEPALIDLYGSLGWTMVDPDDDEGPLMVRAPR